MPKIKYKEISPEMARLARPNLTEEGRVSIGLESKIGEYYLLPIEKIKPYKYQSRRRFAEEELKQLAETIKEFGVRQPISIMPSEEGGYYEVVSGERRLRAAEMASLKTIPCLIIKDKQHAEELSLIENIQREDLHPIELGDAYARILKDKRHGAMSLLAEKIGKSKSTISEHMKLSGIPEEIKIYLIKKNLRSKKILRKVSSLPSVEEMKVFLGMVPSIKNHFFKNVMRVAYEDGSFKFESGQLKKLNHEELKKLKEALISFASSL